MDRRQQADEKYRRLFYERKLDKYFEYVRFEKKDQILVKCKRCGTEARKTKGAFVGRQSRLICKECKNGTLLYSAEVDKILAYYEQGHTVLETCEKFGVSSVKLNDYVKRRGVSNGRTINEINAGKAKAAALASLPEREDSARRLIEARGFEYLGGYARTDSTVLVKCKGCGETSSRSMETFRHSTATCQTCKHTEMLARLEKKKQEREQENERAKVLRAFMNPIGLSPYQIERQKELDKPRTCIVCGNKYTIRLWQALTGSQYVRVTGYCSLKCQHEKKKEYNRQYKERTGHDSGTHRKRARKFGVYDCGQKITVKTYAKRYGLDINKLHCSICGRLCDPNDATWSKYTGPLKPSIDHIIPLVKGGAHDWGNVQIACMECNSKKSGNYDEGGEAV